MYLLFSSSSRAQLSWTSSWNIFVLYVPCKGSPDDTKVITAVPEGSESPPSWRNVNSQQSSIRRAQAIADTGLGQEQLRTLGIGLDLLAELADINAQILRVGQLIPQLLQQEAMGQDLAGVLHQHAQQIVLLRRQLD